MLQLGKPLDLDEEFLWHLAIDSSLKIILEEDVKPEIIFDELIRGAFEFQVSYYRKYSEWATSAILETEFQGENLVFNSPSTNIEDLIARLRKRYLKRASRQLIGDLTKKSINDPESVADGLISAGRSLQKQSSSHKEVFAENSFQKALQRYHERVAKGRGPSLGFQEMDDYFYGQEYLTFICASPKALKSWFTIKSFLANIEAGRNPILYSLELPAEVSDMRLRCMAAEVPFWKYLHRKLEDQDIIQLEWASELLEEKGAYTIVKPPVGQRNPSYLYQFAKDHDCELIYVDQLQYVENRKGNSLGSTNDTKDFFDVCDQFKDYADDLPIWIVHQYNRGALGKDEFPEMAQIKSSASIEETGTLVLGLYSNKDMRASNIIQIGTLASRNYGRKIWEVQSTMNRDCQLKMIGEVEE